MLKLLKFLFFVLLVSSCKKPMASFQASHYDAFEKSVRSSKKTEMPPLNTPFKELEKSEMPIAMGLKPAAKVEVREEAVRVKKAINHPVLVRKPTINTLKASLFKDKPTKKKHRRPALNDSLKTGIVFLGIAILLSLLGLNQLVLIFGLVSVLFLYFGLKKYYRRNRIRNIFRK
jgi:hypothetical protein